MNWTTPAAVEQAFYEAFAGQDLDAMMAVWAGDRPVFCIHPSGELLTGRGAIERSWKQIFRAEVPFRFELEHHHREEFAGRFAIAQLDETLYLRDRAVAVVQVTNGYCATDDGWRMMLHHASPQPDSGPAADAAGPSPVLH